MSYTVRFDRGNRAWTCSVFTLGENGRVSGSALASGSGSTRDDARNAAAAGASDPEIRAALERTDNSRPYWVQDAVGGKQEVAAAPAARKRHPKS